MVVCRARDWHRVRLPADPASAAPSVRRSVPARLVEVQQQVQQCVERERERQLERELELWVEALVGV